MAVSETPHRSLVLVADDDADILALIEYRLTTLGYEVVTATDGEAALQRCAERVPDLCLLDVMMPRVGGLEVLHGMRADPALEQVPVILLTARVKDDDVERGFDAGADDYLRKPFRLEDLRARVEALLERA